MNDVTPEERANLECLPPQQQELVWLKYLAVEAILKRDPKVPMSKAIYKACQKERVTPDAVRRWIHAVQKHGILGLIDGRKFNALPAAKPRP